MGFLVPAILLCGIGLVLGKTLKIATIAEPPFVYREDGKKPSGYLIEVLNLLQQQIGFDDYDLYFVEDGKYGAKQRDGTWNGLIGDLVSGKADVVLAPLSINSQRLGAIDFTYPFMEVGISIAIQRPLPGEAMPFTNLYELVSSSYKYGAVKDGNTATYFNGSNYVLHKEMAKLMFNEWGEDNLPATTQEAIIKLKDGRYAHLGESAYLNYWTGRDCSIMTVGSQVTRTAYGLGLQKGSELAGEINQALLRLREDGTLDGLYLKWWNSDKCEEPKLCVC